VRESGLAEIKGQIGVAPSRGRGWRKRTYWMQLVSLSAKWIQKLRSRPARRLRVSETLSLGDKRQLLLIECGDRQLLIGAAGNFLATLAELRPAVGANPDAKEGARENGGAAHE
jgi:flagellar biogenesis protein FliO